MAKDAKYGTIDIPGIDEDEPVFVIRAQDGLAIQAIHEYLNLNSSPYNRQVFAEANNANLGLSLPTDTEVDEEWKATFEEKVFPAFREWQQAHPDRVKFAD